MTFDRNGNLKPCSIPEHEIGCDSSSGLVGIIHQAEHIVFGEFLPAF